MPIVQETLSFLKKSGVAPAIVVVLASLSMAEEELKSVDATPGKPPSDAVVLFDGGGTEAFLSVRGTPCPWPVADGAMTVKDGFIVSKLRFRDAQIHVEFAVPDIGESGGNAGNSGVYIHGLYEMQIFNCYANPMPAKETIGAIYGISGPLVNASRRPGEWQTYDVFYTAPRRDEAGKIAEPGAITAMLNGVLVQCGVHFTESVSIYNPLVYQTTPLTDKIREHIQKTGCGPLFLQDHGSPVRFRNIWIRPLDDKAQVFQE